MHPQRKVFIVDHIPYVCVRIPLLFYVPSGSSYIAIDHDSRKSILSYTSIVFLATHESIPMSDAPSSKPTYLYKLIPSSAPPPSPLPSSLPLSDLDTHSGFIHLSTSRQVPRTLKHFFADEHRVYVLRIPYDSMQKDIKWEDPKGKGTFAPNQSLLYY